MTAEIGQHRRRVLFVCVGNACRSQLVAAVAQEVLGSDVQVECAGTDTTNGAGAASNAVECCEVITDRGLHLESHQSRSVRSVDLALYDVVVALTPSIAEFLRKQAGAPAEIEVMNIPDRHGGGLKAYGEAVEALEVELRRIFRAVSTRSAICDDV
jgi:protein-tyrosine-phosphatase